MSSIVSCLTLDPQSDWRLLGWKPTTNATVVVGREGKDAATLPDWQTARCMLSGVSCGDENVLNPIEVVSQYKQFLFAVFQLSKQV